MATSLLGVGQSNTVEGAVGMLGKEQGFFPPCGRTGCYVRFGTKRKLTRFEVNQDALCFLRDRHLRRHGGSSIIPPILPVAALNRDGFPMPFFHDSHESRGGGETEPREQPRRIPGPHEVWQLRTGRIVVEAPVIGRLDGKFRKRPVREEFPKFLLAVGMCFFECCHRVIPCFPSFRRMIPDIRHLRHRPAPPMLRIKQVIAMTVFIIQIGQRSRSIRAFPPPERRPLLRGDSAIPVHAHPHITRASLAQERQHSPRHPVHIILKSHLRAVFLEERLEGFQCGVEFLFPHQARHDGRHGTKFNLAVGKCPVEPSPLGWRGLREKIRHRQQYFASPPEARFQRKLLGLARNTHRLGEVTNLLFPDSGRQIGVAEVRVGMVDEVDFLDHAFVNRSGIDFPVL